MGLLTVRLSESDEKLAKELRAKGVPIADLVRSALRKEHQRHTRKPRTAREVKKFLAELDSKYPIPPGTPSHGIDTTDRKAVQAYIVARLKRKKIQ